MILDDLSDIAWSIFNMFDYESISAHMIINLHRECELDIDNDLSKVFIEKISSSVEHRKISGSGPLCLRQKHEERIR